MSVKVQSVSYDIIVIGAGIIGVNVALELKRRHGYLKIMVLEKESELGAHGSGRNSGVLHAGFYYTADSLKARFTRDGNRALRDYIKSKKLPINECGKLVVTKRVEELSQLELLFERAAANGVEVHELTEREAKQIEPRVRTHTKALYSPHTATANPLHVLQALHDDAVSLGIDFQFYEKLLSYSEGEIRTDKAKYSAGYYVNSAGLQADQVARMFGFSKEYAILPFKGLYLYSSEPANAFKTNIYPVPDLRNPFLGVHVTVTTDGHAKIGPTAIPALWREQYQGMSRFSARELFEIGMRGMSLWFNADFDFRSLAREEFAKYNKRHLVQLSTVLADDIKPESFTRWGKPGIRAQLIHLKERRLVMDFLFEGDERSFHVLNTVSPGWTCSFPFSAYLVDHIERYAGISSR